MNKNKKTLVRELPLAIFMNLEICCHLPTPSSANKFSKLPRKFHSDLILSRCQTNRNLEILAVVKSLWKKRRFLGRQIQKNVGRWTRWPWPTGTTLLVCNLSSLIIIGTTRGEIFRISQVYSSFSMQDTPLSYQNTKERYLTISCSSTLIFSQEISLLSSR